MLGHDLEKACTKFHKNRLIIDIEMDDKHALQIIVSWTIVANNNMIWDSSLTRYLLKAMSKLPHSHFKVKLAKIDFLSSVSPFKMTLR